MALEREFTRNRTKFPLPIYEYIHLLNSQLMVKNLEKFQDVLHLFLVNDEYNGRSSLEAY